MPLSLFRPESSVLSVGPLSLHPYIQNLYGDAKAQTLGSSYLGDAIMLINWLDEVSAYLDDGAWEGCALQR